jgi:hypothetical protein
MYSALHPAPPTQLKAYQDLVQDEMTKRLAEPCSMKLLRDAQLVNIGMNLENDQCVKEWLCEK